MCFFLIDDDKGSFEETKSSHSVLFRTKQGLNHKIRVEKSFKGSIIDSLARCSVWIIGTEARNRENLEWGIRLNFLQILE